MFKNKHCVCQYMSIVHTIQLSAHTTKRLHEYRENMYGASVRFYQIYVNWWSHLNPIHLESLLFSHKYLWKIDKNENDDDEKPKFNTSEDFSYKCSYFTFKELVATSVSEILRTLLSPELFYTHSVHTRRYVCFSFAWHDKVRRKNNENLTWLPWLRNNTAKLPVAHLAATLAMYKRRSLPLHYSAHMILLVAHYVKQTSEIR